MLDIILVVEKFNNYNIGCLDQSEIKRISVLQKYLMKKDGMKWFAIVISR